MERTPESDGNDEPKSFRKKPKQPLWHRMYFQKSMTDVVRLMEYDELPVEEARARLMPLIETYGKAAIEEAARELVIVDDTKTPAVARLSDEARALAIQILGRPPQPGGASPSGTPARTPDAPSNETPTPPQSRRSRTAFKNSADSASPSPSADTSRVDDSQDSLSNSRPRSRKPTK
jgi:hypothetical protein